jgi:glycogen debranching enzyme
MELVNLSDTTVIKAVACSPQAWAAGSLLWMLISGLGIIPDGLQGTLRIRRPSLPRRINRVAGGTYGWAMLVSSDETPGRSSRP